MEKRACIAGHLQRARAEAEYSLEERRARVSGAGRKERTIGDCYEAWDGWPPKKGHPVSFAVTSVVDSMPGIDAPAPRRTKRSGRRQEAMWPSKAFKRAAARARRNRFIGIGSGSSNYWSSRSD